MHVRVHCTLYMYMFVQGVIVHTLFDYTCTMYILTRHIIVWVITDVQCHRDQFCRLG